MASSDRSGSDMIRGDTAECVAAGSNALSPVTAIQSFTAPDPTPRTASGFVLTVRPKTKSVSVLSFTQVANS